MLTSSLNRNYILYIIIYEGNQFKPYVYIYIRGLLDAVVLNLLINFLTYITFIALHITICLQYYIIIAKIHTIIVLLL